MHKDGSVSISVKATVRSRKITSARWSWNPKAGFDGAACKVASEGQPAEPDEGQKGTAQRERHPMPPGDYTQPWPREPAWGGCSLESSALM